MTTWKTTSPWPAPAGHWSHPARRLAAALLRGAGALLESLARRVAVPARAANDSVWPEYEFHAEAGAPEGALYVNGQLVGVIEGVRRL